MHNIGQMHSSKWSCALHDNRTRRSSGRIGDVVLIVLASRRSADAARDTTTSKTTVRTSGRWLRSTEMDGRIVRSAEHVAAYCGRIGLAIEETQEHSWLSICFCWPQ